MPTVMITGANRGLGLEFARQYLADGWRVVAACRTPKLAKELVGLKGNIKIRPLDVTDAAQVRALARSLKGTAIDVLINNAGIFGPRKDVFGRVNTEAWDEAFRVNVMAPMLISEVFADHVTRSEKKIIVAITSKMGSIEGTNTGGGYIYRSSKAALNMVMRSLSVTLRPRGITVAMIHPGWVRTDMGGAGAAIDPVESVAAMRKLIAGLKPKASGSFYNYDGTPIPW